MTESAEALRFLAAARKEYCGRCPQSQDEMREMDPASFAVHMNHETSEWLADILDGKNDGKGWLPSWRWDEWSGGGLVRLAIPKQASPSSTGDTAALLAAGVFRSLPTREQFAITLHSFDGFAIETGERWSDCNEDRQGAFLYQADAVLALINGDAK